MKFYGFIDAMNWEGGISTKFYATIDDAILADVGRGEIIEFDIPSNGIPVSGKIYDVHQIEAYELFGFLKDNPPMNEDNYLVYSHGDEDYEGMLTIVCLS